MSQDEFHCGLVCDFSATQYFTAISLLMPLCSQSKPSQLFTYFCFVPQPIQILHTFPVVYTHICDVITFNNITSQLSQYSSSSCKQLPKTFHRKVLLLLSIYQQLCIAVLISWETLLRRKVTWGKGPVTELKHGTYTLSWSFSHELSVPAANPSSSIALCTGCRCATIHHLGPTPWGFLA